jgi:hypothetical protein
MTFALSFHTSPANAILNMQISYHILPCNIETEPTKCMGNAAAAAGDDDDDHNNSENA